MGNSQADIFSHPDCSLYLISLYQQNKITLEVAMTVYAYLLALMQFTHRQPLKGCDQDVKSIQPVKVYFFSANGKITLEGEEYLSQIKNRYDEFNLALDIDALKAYFLTLSPVEQWLISVENEKLNDVIIAAAFEETRYSSADELRYALYINLPFLASYPNDFHFSSKKMSVLLPSTSVINKLMSFLSTNPMKMLPILGRVGLPTLENLHNNNQHPVAFYSTAIKSNLTDVHHLEAVHS